MKRTYSSDSAEYSNKRSKTNYQNEQPESAIQLLAKKYNVPFRMTDDYEGHGLSSDAHCPGVVSPLGETPDIQLKWSYGWCNKDRSERCKQFEAVLNIIDQFFENPDGSSLQNSYITLDIRGRVMFTYIASLNSSGLIDSIAPYAKSGLIDDEVSSLHAHCNNINNRAIFSKYINPIIKEHTTPSITKSVINALDSFNVIEGICGIICEYAAYDYDYDV